MKKTVFICFLLIMLCACNSKRQLLPAITSIPTESFETTDTVFWSEPQSEVFTEPVTEPPYMFPLQSGSYLKRYTDDETQDYLDYYLFVPENATEQMPLVVFLHGDGEVGKPNVLKNFGPILSARDIYGEEFPFIAISPCTRIKSWINGSIPQTLMGLIDEISARLSINTERIIITGHSRGAVGVWYLISAYGDYFSAAIPVSCGSAIPLNMDNCILVPIKAVVGNIGENENHYLSAMDQIVQEILKNGGNAELIILRNRNHGSTSLEAYSEELFEWMLSQ